MRVAIKLKFLSKFLEIQLFFYYVAHIWNWSPFWFGDV